MRLRVDWLASSDLAGPGRVGLTLCPGRKDRGRDLTVDLETLAEGRGMRFHHLPIRDQGVPSQEEAVGWMRAIDRSSNAGGHIVVHCMGGLGRSGTIAAGSEGEIGCAGC